jgi:hypothetical protein
VWNDRITRPEPERTQPIRSWTQTLFGMPPPANGERASAAPLEDVVSRSVELGYRVVDDYLREGQRVAERFGGRGFGADALVGDMQQLTARMARYTSDVFEVWFQLLQLAMGGRVRPPENAAPAAPVAAPEAPAASRIRIAVDASQPTEVVLDLRPDAAGRRLLVHALRPADGGEGARLGDVSIEPDAGGAVVRVRVPPRHPAGVYNGLVIDEETTCPAGTLSVRVGVP